MKKLLLVLPVLLILGACGNKTVSTTNETAVNSVPQTQAQVNNNIPAEYKQVTVNENGVKIYGKIVGNSDGIGDNASQTMKGIYNSQPNTIKNQKERGITYTFSEYYSDSYGGTVYIQTNNKSGGREIYNENGECFMSGDAKSKNYDLENTLAKYRLGNAMAEAIDRKASGK